MLGRKLIVHQFGVRDYITTWRDMQAFTASRTEDTTDELWLLEHPPVFTQGLAGKEEHVIEPGDIPVVSSDRGGQITYHGPGQIVAYTLIDIKRCGLGIKPFVRHLEQSVIELLAGYGIAAKNRPDAPGVYVNGDKIASLGLRVKRGRAYHGLSLNVNMDLEPFSRITPCGLSGIGVTQLRNLDDTADIKVVAQKFSTIFAAQLGYTSVSATNGRKRPENQRIKSKKQL